MKVRELMTEPPVAVTTDTPVRHVVELMAEHHVSGLPVVVADGTVVGLVSEGDLVSRADVLGRSCSKPAEGDGSTPAVVRDACVAGGVMSTPAYTIDENDELRLAARLMSRQRIKRLPVTRHGKLCGVISRSDVMRVFLRSDDDIRTEIENDVLNGKVLDTAHDIHVDVQDGVVTLRGTAARRSTADVVCFHCSRVDGVSKVVDHLLHGADDVTSPDDYPMTATMGFGPRGDRM